MIGHRFVPAAWATAVIGGMMLASPIAAQAATHEFIIINRGQQTVVEAHAMTETVRLLVGDSWGANILGKAELGPNVEMHFNAPQNTSGCKQDLKFVYRDGHIAIGRAIDICTIREVQLHY